MYLLRLKFTEQIAQEFVKPASRGLFAFYFQLSGPRMKLRNFRDLIVRAVRVDGERLTDLALHMRDCERAKQILYAKGYGQPGITVAQLAALVPDAPTK